MRILVDTNNPFVREAFSEFGTVELLRTSEFTREAVRDADALIIRSETRITHELLEGSRVRFVGTVSAGTDHVDAEYLAHRGIAFASAPGCNADSVAEYVAAALVRHGAGKDRSLRHLTLGVVGFGNTGSRVARKAQALGMRVLRNDPPLERTTGRGGFVSLDELMESDIISLHVPLTKGGTDPTYRLFGAGRLEAMKPASVLINTARGPVVDATALRRLLASGHISAAMLDVWEDEPRVDAELLERAELGTPHIAGYSYDGKVNGVEMIHRAMAQFLLVEPKWGKPARLVEPEVRSLSMRRRAERIIEKDLWEAVKACSRLEADDQMLRSIARLDAERRSAEFRRLRAQYPVRREFRATSVTVFPYDQALAQGLSAVGFSVEAQRGAS